MIIAERYAPLRTTRETLAAHLADEINAFSPRSRPAVPDTVREIARGVAACLAEHETHIFRAETGQMWRLTSTALRAAGEDDLARRVAVFGSGLAQTADWNVAGGKAMVVLDLKRALPGDGIILELAMYRIIGAALEAVADSWDDSLGDGTLALRRVNAAAAAILGSAAGRRRTAALAAEIPALCRRKLEHLRIGRGWRKTPHVIVL